MTVIIKKIWLNLIEVVISEMENIQVGCVYFSFFLLII